MKTITMYQIWSMNSFSDDEPPCPLFMEYEDESYLKVLDKFHRMHEEKQMCAIFVSTKIVKEPSDEKLIFESPDNGKTIYVRNFGCAERRLLEDDESDKLRGLFKIK